MDCNKDEAVRAKAFAENKLKERDFVGAKKLALKAQDLFPKLEGLSQFLDVINVYVANGQTRNGIVDYYGILGVDPSADEETMRKQYKRMALSIHPDKNKVEGAVGAFMILSQAWGVLSNKDQRSAYEMMLNNLNLRAPSQAGSFNSKTHATYHPPVFTRPYTTPCQPSSYLHHPSHQWAPPAASSHYTPQPTLYPTTGTSTMNVPLSGNQQSSARNPPPISQHQKTPAPAATAQKRQSQFACLKNQSNSSTCSSSPESFWTSCNGCTVMYEFNKIYLDHTLLCRRCQQPFLATAMPAPFAKSRTPPQRRQDPVVASGGTTNMSPSIARTTQDDQSQPSIEHAKRGSDNLGTASVPSTVSGGYHKPSEKTRNESQKCQAAGGKSRFKRASVPKQQSNSVEELSKPQTRIMLKSRAKLDILNQLSKWNCAKSDSPQLKRVNRRRDSLDTLDQVGKVIHPRTDKSTDALYPNVEETVIDAPDEYESMVVPDANFHNFDNDRIEESFTEGQIWAVYDDDDGMPRYYALVQHVLSRCPFKMQISWLNSNSSSEFGPLVWIPSGFTKTSGNFRTGKSVISKRLNSFSHPVKSVKGARGVIQIFPTKGDVWALYRNWSPDWDETTAAEIIHKYDVVVVLEDYTEDRGVLVAPLFKVPGFTSVFNQLLDQRTISRKEMFRFSHQVPFYVLSGLEAENVPKNCFELDPAALPLELLNVTTDLDSVEGRVSGQPHVKETSSKDTKPLLTYSRRNKKKKIGASFSESRISESLDAV